ncbi:beta-glucosidase 12-like [Prunus yedoensis var. nudiflora]|uniref:Beta-glucosidase 12-like n=1 Tax=Prunus yedoensis var. nudiflora TaxID=2094558 RepID=A0A314YJU0_PRUYE|nr:beta-glucosidase 12-like [Prunus yedoensis var. nudiflora]
MHSTGNSATEPYIVSHNLLLAHATVVELYIEKFPEKQGGQIGISLVGHFNADQKQKRRSIGPQAEGNSILYIIYPQGVKKLLEFMNKNYRNPIIYITENGITEPKDNKRELDAALKDPHRIENNLRHLYWMNRAMKNGVNLEGYFHWALFDDYEWGDGYTLRFGLYYIDYKNNLTRIIPKESAKWLPKFLEG